MSELPLSKSGDLALPDAKNWPRECPNDQDRRSKILDFQDLISKLPGAVFGDSDACPLKHSFAGGIYVREILIPKGMTVVGKIHRSRHPVFLMSGDASVFTERNGLQRIKGPVYMMSEAGIKRVIYAHTDLVWVTVHEVGEERNLKKIEDMVISPSYSELDEKGIERCQQIASMTNG